MERQYTRLDEARNLIDPLIKGITDEEDKRGAYVHLYGTGLCAAILALKRGYDRKMYLISLHSLRMKKKK
ncbi:MAG: hypothetical protein K6E39_04485 [Lachnospiraceae bacterium]|nr:hypothetical protein [Lachnospiraceae bacterium]